MGVPFHSLFSVLEEKGALPSTLAEIIKVQISLLHISGTLNEMNS